MMPEKFGRYEVKFKIESGGMGTVYRAYDPRFERYVALKVLPTQVSNNQQARARFMLEAKTIAKLEHAAIVPVYDYGEHEGQLYFVMRLMNGRSLSHRLQQGPLPASTASDIIKRLGAALNLAHRNGIIHRDLKPANILFDEENKAYLSDFGIAKIVESTINLTGTAGFVGTWPYMSPEQFQSNQKVDHRADIYALGVILYEMLTGKRPFQADTPAEWIGAHINEPVPFIHEVRSGLPLGCEVIVERAMAKAPEDRFESAGKMAEALESLTRPTLSYWERDEILATIRLPGTVVTTQAKEERKRSFMPQPLLKRWKWLVVFALITIILFTLINRLFGIFATNPVPTISLAITKSPAAEASIAESPVHVPVISTSSTPETGARSVVVLSYSDSAIWQGNTILERIPESGLVPLPVSGEALFFQSNAKPMELALPDKTSLFLNSNTELSINGINGIDGAGETSLTLFRGSLVVSSNIGQVFISSPFGSQVRLDSGILGVAQDEERFDVDCLQGQCRLIGASSSEMLLSGGEHMLVSESGELKASDGARYAFYSLFVNVLAITPTPTQIPSATATATLAPTATPTVVTAVPVSVPTAATSSPAGLIVFTCFIDENDDLCTVNLHDSSQNRITTETATDFYASIAPNDGQILFSSRRAGSFLMYSVNPDGSQPRQIGPTNLGAIFAPALSPDGEKIAFTVAANGSQNIWVMSRDGSDLTQLTNFDGNSVDAVWSPDGRQIAFASDHNSNGQGMAHFIINIDGTGLRQITTNVDQIGGRSDWSPDGRWLAFYAGPDDDRDIYLAAIDGSAVYQLTDGGGNLAPSFSPDGGWLAFTSYRDGDAEIYMMRLDGSDVRQLTFNNYPDWQPRWGVQK